jgi:biopolymer transport protein ExbD
MLDLAFQVLLFFILTYHPSQLEGMMDMSLPDVAQAKAAKPEDAHISAPGELEIPAEITVVLGTQLDQTGGAINRITVQEPQGARDLPDEKALERHLERVRPGLTNQDDLLLKADGPVKYKEVMKIMDACTHAGFRNVSFGPPPDLTPGG